MQDVIVIGGGLAGLTAAIQLSKGGLKVLVIEKKSYPMHRVCGEYISNEVGPFLASIGLDLKGLGAADITQLEVTSTRGSSLRLPLGLGGFGISRYTLDHELYKIALSLEVDFMLLTQVDDVKFREGFFEVLLPDSRRLTAKMVLGCFGKRSNLDRQMKRDFFSRKSPYMGVKYHIKTNHSADLIGLHIFKNGYCGISKIEDDKFCLCYLTERSNLQQYGTLHAMEDQVLRKNPFLSRIFAESDFLYDKPEVINEISFEKKSISEDHVLMAGDSVGMISPLCGNGMSMAIHSGKMLSGILLDNWHGGMLNCGVIEAKYQSQWHHTFHKRLYAGRKIQQLFGHELLTSAAILLLKKFKGSASRLIEMTHGETI